MGAIRDDERGELSAQPVTAYWIFDLCRRIIYGSENRKCSEEELAMSLNERVAALKNKHETLDAALDAETSRPHPDEIEILSLKKQKLRIKDEIVTLAGS